MRQIYLTKEDLIRFLDLLDPSSRIEFDIQHDGKAAAPGEFEAERFVAKAQNNRSICLLG